MTTAGEPYVALEILCESCDRAGRRRSRLALFSSCTQPGGDRTPMVRGFRMLGGVRPVRPEIARFRAKRKVAARVAAENVAAENVAAERRESGTGWPELTRQTAAGFRVY